MGSQQDSYKGDNLVYHIHGLYSTLPTKSSCPVPASAVDEAELAP